MLQSPITPTSHTLSGDRRSKTKTIKTKFEQQQHQHQHQQQLELASNMDDDNDDMFDDDLEGGEGGKGRSKSRRELPTGAVTTLKAWLLSPEHFTHPYPTPQDQAMLMQKTGIDKKQLKNWFTNARRRIWKPMLKKQIEQGKLSATAAPGVSVGVGVGSTVPGLMMGGMQVQVNGGAPGEVVTSMENPNNPNPHSVQAMRAHYQQAMQDQPLAVVQQQAAIQQAPVQQQAQAPAVPLDNYGNPLYNASLDAAPLANCHYYGSSDLQMAQNSSIGTLAQLASSSQLSKTDSHAVLMELFARDQDLVRQATESARLKAESKQQPQGQAAAIGQQQGGQQAAAPTSQHPMMKAPLGGTPLGVPTLNSWPHFSSITSLNNLGTIPGVKSIASLSGVDLASKGNVNKMGNIAQVKSMESMGKNDSYAFLEVFFGDRSSNNLSGMGGGAGNTRGMQSKQSGDEDNEIGLSLEDESPSSHPIKKEYAQAPAPIGSSYGMVFGSHPSSTMGQGQHDGSSTMGSGTLKRSYEDALAARGLISVSRSCEKLTDLVLPAKIQRTLSQEFINMQQEQQVRQQHHQQQQQKDSQQTYSQHFQHSSTAAASQQYPGQQPTEPQGSGGIPNEEHVQVSSSSACALCSQTNIDTQLRPCGHMFHERCLKPSLSNPNGTPKCPIDDIPIHSAVLAVPDNTNNTAQQQAQSGGWSYAQETDAA